MQVVVRQIVAVVALVGLAACAGTPTAAEAPTDGRQTPQSAAVTGTPTIQSVWTSCAVDAPVGNDGRPPDAVALPRLGTDFAVAAAVHCQLEPKRRAGGGEDLILTEGRATDVTTLLAALRLPDDTTTVEACTLEMPWVPNLLLLDAQGRWIRIGLPDNACGKLRPEVTEAVRGLRLTTVSETVVREIVSAGAAAAGCHQDWSDVLATETRDPRLLPRPGRVSLPSQVRLCVYRVPTQQQGTPQPAGTFEYGLLLPQHQRVAIEQTLTALRPAEQCSDAADRFAALQDATITGDVVYVELDHCRRVLATPLYGPPILVQADTALIELLSR
ncbi:hypothetical protein AB0J14_34705 [Micromonospora arborensis]|uniref:hypothetical protein n=1 Tax=Micromonospora arborensis TaxID=2116518 RepID=UPI0034015D0A